jgi:AraC-like DNA-binding protein
MIFVAGISVALFFDILLLSKKNKSSSDKILAVWMFVIAVHLFLFYVYSIGELYNYPFLLGLTPPLPLLHGVFLYLYVASVTNQLPVRKRLLVIHFVPAIATMLYLIPFLILPSEQKIAIFRNQGAGYEAFNRIVVYAIGISGVVYITWSALLLRSHRRRILDRFSYQDKIDLQWLRILTWGMGGIWLLIFLRNDPDIYAGVAVFVFLIGFFGIRQVRIFPSEEVPVPPSEHPSLLVQPEREKYAKSGLKTERLEQLYQELIRLMDEQRIYTKTDLSVDDLATHLKVHPNYLSQVINEKVGKNFYDFVNQYRLEEFKRLLSDPKNRHLTLLSLAIDCGFNSKSSFNRHFKKVTGQTPSQYFAALKRDSVQSALEV